MFALFESVLRHHNARAQLKARYASPEELVEESPAEPMASSSRVITVSYTA